MATGVDYAPPPPEPTPSERGTRRNPPPNRRANRSDEGGEGARSGTRGIDWTNGDGARPAAQRGRRGRRLPGHPGRRRVAARTPDGGRWPSTLSDRDRATGALFLIENHSTTTATCAAAGRSVLPPVAGDAEVDLDRLAIALPTCRTSSRRDRRAQPARNAWPCSCQPALPAVPDALDRSRQHRDQPSSNCRGNFARIRKLTGCDDDACAARRPDLQRSTPPGSQYDTAGRATCVPTSSCASCAANGP